MYLDRLAEGAPFRGGGARIWSPRPGTRATRAPRLDDTPPELPADARHAGPDGVPDIISDEAPVRLDYPVAAFLPDMGLLAMRMILSALVIGFGVIMPGAVILAWIGGTLLALFLIEAMGMVLRMATRVDYTSSRIESRIPLPWNRSIPTGRVQWDELIGLTLRRRRGWLRGSAPLWCEMSIVSRAGHVSIDHRIERFARLAERAWHHARAAQVPLDQQTVRVLSDLKMHGGFGRIGEHMSMGVPRDHFEKMGTRGEDEMDDLPPKPGKKKAGTSKDGGSADRTPDADADT